MKKYILGLLSILLVICLIGCSSSKTDSSSNDAQSKPSVTEDVQGTTSDATPVETPAPVETATPVEASAPVEIVTPTEVPEPTKEPEPTAAPEPVYEEDAFDSLKAMFESRGMKVGTCLTGRMIDDEDYSELIIRHFSSATMENSMKPDATFNQKASIENGELTVVFPNDAINMLNWCKENGISMRGHTLVWYSQTPDWIFRENFDKKGDFVGRDEMLKRLESAIKSTFTQLIDLGYADMFYAYDIVNEYWMEDGSMRSNNWTKTIGDDYVWWALYYARQYAPETIDLYINDYNEQYKYKSVLKFIDTLKDDEGNYMMDGIGLQAHLYTGDDQVEYFKAVDKLASTGLKLQITELDVALGRWQHELKGTDENLQLQGRYYYDLFKGLFDRIDAGTLKMDSVTFWGFTDYLSWRKSASPLLFYKNLEPKYAYYGVIQNKSKAGFTEE